MSKFDVPKKIFISHHNSQAGQLSAFKKGIERAGFKAFLAHEDIEPGEHDLDCIEKELRACNVFLYISSKESNESHFCQQEIGMAKALEKQIITVIIKEVTLLGFIARLLARSNKVTPLGFIAHIQGIKCNSFDTILSNVFEYLPKSEEVKKHLDILKVKGFSKEKKEDYIYLEKDLEKDNDKVHLHYYTRINLSLNGDNIACVKSAYDGQLIKNHSLDRLPQFFTHFNESFFTKIYLTFYLSEQQHESLKFLMRDCSTIERKERISIHKKNQQIFKYSIFKDD